MSELLFKSLFDEDSFVKTLAFLHGNGTGGDGSDECVTGYGSIDQRLVFAAVDSPDDRPAVHGTVFIRKVIRTLDAAVAHKAPFLLSINGSLSDISGGAEVLYGYSGLLESVKRASGKIPLIFIVRGDCLGLNAALASMFDFVFLYGVDASLSALSDTAVNIASNRNESVNKLKFDSKYTALHSEAVSCICEDIDALKKTLSSLFNYLPESADSGAPGSVFNSGKEFFSDDIARLRGIKLCKALSDDYLCFETGSGYGTGIVTAFGKIFGRTAGFVSCDTGDSCGLIGTDALKKIRRFQKYCITFNIPVVNLLDFTGVKVSEGDAFEFPAVIADILTPPRCANRCKAISIVVGSASGMLAPVFIKRRESDAGNIALAWDGTYVDAIDPAAAALMKYADDIRSDPDPAAARQKYIALYKTQNSSAAAAAEKGLIDDIIDPAETRLRIAAFLNIL